MLLPLSCSPEIDPLLPFRSTFLLHDYIHYYSAHIAVAILLRFHLPVLHPLYSKLAIIEHVLHSIPCSYLALHQGWSLKEGGSTLRTMHCHTSANQFDKYPFFICFVSYLFIWARSNLLIYLTLEPIANEFYMKLLVFFYDVLSYKFIKLIISLLASS